MKTLSNILEEQHQIIAEVEARTTAMNHLEQISSFSA
jgi:two-component SAPR family response regulator